VSDVVKSLWTKLYAWALPSALAVGAYWLVVYPRTWLGHDWLGKATDAQLAAAFVGVVVVLALTLDTFSSPLYRILEGYLLWPRWLQRRGVRGQIRRKARLARDTGHRGWRRGLDLEDLARYPEDEDQIAPTRFGNALRAFETYGKARYNLDVLTVWYELFAACPKTVQSDIIDKRAAVDFFVAWTYIAGLLAVTTLLVAGSECALTPTLIVFALVWAMAAFLAHWLAVRATDEWGYAVKAMVNTGRIKLADSLGLEMPKTLAEEKLMWGYVTGYAYYGDDGNAANLERFRKTRPAPPAEDDDLGGGDARAGANADD
jgi:hypothetical protein